MLGKNDEPGPLPIERAPYRIRREHYRRERRNSILAVLVIATVVGLAAYGVHWLVVRG